MQNYRKSQSWQLAAAEAQRQRGYSDITTQLSQYERWLFTKAQEITGVPPAQFLKLCIHGKASIDSVADDVGELVYQLEEAHKTDLAALETAENYIDEYAQGIRRQVAELDAATRDNWGPMR